MFRFIAGVSILWAMSGLAAGSLRAQPAQKQTAVHALCSMLCGGTWRVKLPPGQTALTQVSYTYGLDTLGVMVVGKGVFQPAHGPVWIDMHYYMADPDGKNLRYMGISPKAGMTTGTVKLRPNGFTTIVNQLNVAQLFARIANDFPNAKMHVMTIYQSEDGFEKPSAKVELVR